HWAGCCRGLNRCCQTLRPLHLHLEQQLVPGHSPFGNERGLASSAEKPAPIISASKLWVSSNCASDGMRLVVRHESSTRKRRSVPESRARLALAGKDAAQPFAG